MTTTDTADTRQQSYIVTLEKFEGPLDLLLSLIEQEEMDITRLSLAKITDEYLRYIEQKESLSPEHLVDFLVVASQLLVIKSKALLPMLVLEDDEEIDSQLLELRLKQLQLFRQLSDGLAERIADKQVLLEKPFLLSPSVQFIAPPKVDPMVLAEAFAALLVRLPQEEQMEERVVEDVISIKDKVALINRNLRTITKLKFHSLIGDKGSKTEVIVSFLALLELMKQRVVSVEQKELFGDIELMRTDNPNEVEI